MAKLFASIFNAVAFVAVTAFVASLAVVLAIANVEAHGEVVFTYSAAVMFFAVALFVIAAIIGSFFELYGGESAKSSTQGNASSDTTMEEHYRSLWEMADKRADDWRDTCYALWAKRDTDRIVEREKYFLSNLTTGLYDRLLGYSHRKAASRRAYLQVEQMLTEVCSRFAEPKAIKALYSRKAVLA